MRVEADSKATRLIRERGGRLWVWTRPGCCGGTRFIESSLTPPSDPSRFVRIEGVDFELHIRVGGVAFPDVLQIAVKGRRRPRVDVWWNGCSYVV